MTDWKAGLELIKAQKAEYAQWGAIMTAYERATAEREIKNTIDTWKPQIVANLLQEQDQAINRYRVSERGIAKANAAEINRWDAAKLGNELTVTHLLVDQAMAGPNQEDGFEGSTSSKQDRMAQIYQDAQASGDIFKQRAVAEVLINLPIDGDHELNHLVKQADRDLKALRRTEDQQKADEALDASWNDVVTHTVQLEEVAPLIDEYTGVFAIGPFSKALKRVTIASSGERRILDADDIELGGVILKNPEPNFVAEG